MTVGEVAKLLRIAETTVRRLARRGILPAYRVHDAYRFNPVEIQEWALEHEVKIDPNALLARDQNGNTPPHFSEALVRGGIYHSVQGDTPSEVFRNVVQLPGIPNGTDRGLLHDLLVTREALGSTGIGKGIAIPHPRSPLVLRVPAPIALLCFLEHPIDFHAVDGESVRALVVLLSPTIQTHLRMLASVAYALHDEALQGLLRSYAPRNTILDCVRLLEGEGPLHGNEAKPILQNS